MTEKMATYILEKSNGNLVKVTVPAKWKVTFGPAVPYSKGPRNTQYDVGYALRFYENKNQQRAIFTDVKTFRDESISIQERITTTKRQVMQKDGPSGSRDVEVEARVTEWINPDKPAETAPSPEFLQLEHKGQVEL